MRLHRTLGRWVFVLGLAAFPMPLSAQLLGIDLTFQSVAGSVPVTGADTDMATLSFGNVSAFQVVGAGISRTSTAADYSLSTEFGVRVTKALLVLSPNYTLRARLTASQSLTWKVAGVTMSTSFATVATSQPYATTLPHTIAFTVPHSAGAGAIASSFEVLAIAN